jgi:dihydroorotase
MSELLIRNGHVLDPAQGLDAARDVLLRDGRVAEVAAPGSLTADDVVDAKGMIVAPGFIDIHVHLREPGQSYKETIKTGTEAAAAGGFTSVCCMPNTQPVNDAPEATAWMQDRARGAAVNVFPIAAATRGSLGEQLTDFAALKRAGAVGVSDDGRPILRDDIMRECLRKAAELGIPLIQHAEDTRLTGGCSMNGGPTAFRLGLRGISAESESVIVERDIKLARQTGAHIHVAHISTAKALDAVRRGKDAGVRVTCEATPHHILLTDEQVGDYDTNCKMNPPLRSKADREALIAGLLDGTVDCIATDHAPHALHEKQQEFDRAPMGIIGLETALGIAMMVLHHQRGMKLPRIVELLTANPARVLNLAGRGTLIAGSAADVTIFDPEKKWTFDVQHSRSRSRNTPFCGWEFNGPVVATIVGGRTVYRAA